MPRNRLTSKDGRYIFEWDEDGKSNVLITNKEGKSFWVMHSAMLEFAGELAAARVGKSIRSIFHGN